MARPQRPVSKALPLFVCEVNSFPCTEVRHETRCERNQRKEGRKEGRPSRQDSSNGEDQCESKKYKSSRRSTKQNTYIKNQSLSNVFLFNLNYNRGAYWAHQKIIVITKWKQFNSFLPFLHWSNRKKLQGTVLIVPF